ncbi:MAG: methyltransferase domain-containing protein [Eggerthellaceae bacterium]|nr:methyltransferase domain-containing protein [Eggerthellaceae bacterium]
MNETQYKELSIREFTKAAEIYDGGHAGIYEMCKDDYPPILEELRKDDFADLLDVGCGTGPMVELLAAELPGRRYTGLDLTPKMIEVASAKGLDGATFLVGDAEDMPFEDASFDAVICANSFHHYPNAQAFFGEAARVLRPGGKLVLRDYTSFAPVIWLMNHTEMPLANLIGHGDVRAYTLDEVRGFCQAAGLVPRTLEKRPKFRMHLVAVKPAEGDEVLRFGDVQETALVTLAIRASETARPNPRIRDGKAAEIIEAIGADVSKYDPFLSHEGVVARTIMFADALRALIEAHPDAVCVNLGCGFDDKFSQVDNGRVGWFDVDLPDQIAVRRKVFEDRPRCTMLEGDALDGAWTAALPKGRDYIVVMEGVLEYFTKEQTATCLHMLCDSFPHGWLVAEMNSQFIVRHSDKHDAIRNTNASFKWGTESGEEFVELEPRLQLVSEQSYNVEMRKHTLRGRLFAATVGKNVNNRLAIFAW